MSIYTNTGLVAHAENAEKLKTKYMWGGILREITDAYIKQMMRMWGVNASIGYTVQRWQELQALAGQGYFGVDCVGLIKSYYWSGKPNGGTGSPRYDSNTDVNAKTMFQRATVKGKIKDIPETPGLIVYSSAPVHVGVYIGKGLTIESTLGSRGDGVVKHQLDNLWTDWFECPYIDYIKTRPVKIAYPANVRKVPNSAAPTLGKLQPGDSATIYEGVEQTDSRTGYVYVKTNCKYGVGWIVKTAIA